MNLLDEAKKAPKKRVTIKRRSKWNVLYKEVYIFLREEKNYSPKEAIKWISEKEGLSENDENKLYNTAKSNWLLVN